MKAYTVNNHLVGVGNDQILGTDQGGGGGVEYEAGQYISIDENNVISVTGLAPATAIPDTSDMATKTWVGEQGYLTSVPAGYATDQELAEAVSAVSSAIPTLPETEEVEFEELDLSDYALASAVPAAQVNSDWNANSGVAEILNKPTEIQLIAGTNVQVEVTGASAIISAQGGGGHEYTAGPGIEINNYEISTTELASGLQLVAGAGITLTVSGNYLVVGGGADETVLYTASSASNSITTSEEVTHFERLRIELQSSQSTYVKNCLECRPDASNLVYTGTALIPAADYPLQMAGVRYTSSNGKNFTFSSAVRMCYRVNSTYGDSTYSNFASSDIKDVGFITKIVGINRISS